MRRVNYRKLIMMYKGKTSELNAARLYRLGKEIDRAFGIKKDRKNNEDGD